MNVILSQLRFIFIVFLSCISLPCVRQVFAQPVGAASAQEAAPEKSKSDFDEYFDFFKEVYRTMQQNYYQPVELDDFKKFIYVFTKQLYPQMTLAGSSRDYIKWRSAAYLVDALKEQEDIFSMFFPPKEAEKYETTVLGKRIDLGIDGQKVERGYAVIWVEPRSDAYEKGLRKDDVIYEIADKETVLLDEKDIQQLLIPLEGEKVVLRYFEHETDSAKEVEVESREYFKQLAFMIPTDVESIFCIRIERFNRMTAEDITGYIRQILSYPGQTGLIIDLRGNPGGPPLAAREISSFFLEPGSEFAYFQRRGYPKSSLDVPEIPPQFHYKGDMVILIDPKSGSASELFSGILQGKGRAELMGQNSAGQVFLKSMFYMTDGSMVLLVTARGHHPDGTVFPFSGLKPNVAVDGTGRDLVKEAAGYLLEKRRKKTGVLN